MNPPPFRLRFTNPWGEKWFFQNLGALWPHDARRHLIDRTCSDARYARAFETAEEARETLAKAGSPSGWEVLDAEGRVV